MIETFTIYTPNGGRHVVSASATTHVSAFQHACNSIGAKEKSFGFKGDVDDHYWDDVQNVWRVK